MNAKRLYAQILTALTLSSLCVFGQNEFALTLSGTCFQTNAVGKIISQKISDKTLLQEIAQNAGVTDISTLQMVYHENGTKFGDTIDIINPTNGAVLDTIFGFYFGESFDRMVLTNRAGAEKRLDYVYTKQNDHSLGTARINKSTPPTKHGIARKIDGQMKWVITPDNSNGTIRICTGKFTTGKLLFTNVFAVDVP